MHRSDAHGELVEFAFESRAASDLPDAALLRLARQTWIFNARMGLSGEMRLQDGRFLQVVEGRCDIVQALAARILADPRHGSIRIGAFRRLERRRFSGWSLSGLDIEMAGRAPDFAAANLRFVSRTERPLGQVAV